MADIGAQSSEDDGGSSSDDDSGGIFVGSVTWTDSGESGGESDSGSDSDSSDKADADADADADAEAEENYLQALQDDEQQDHLQAFEGHEEHPPQGAGGDEGHELDDPQGLDSGEEHEGDVSEEEGAAHELLEIVGEEELKNSIWRVDVRGTKLGKLEFREDIAGVCIDKSGLIVLMALREIKQEEIDEQIVTFAVYRRSGDFYESRVVAVDELSRLVLLEVLDKKENYEFAKFGFNPFFLEFKNLRKISVPDYTLDNNGYLLFQHLHVCTKEEFSNTPELLPLHRTIFSLQKVLECFDEMDESLPLMQMGGFRFYAGIISESGVIFDNKGGLIGLVFLNYFSSSFVLAPEPIKRFLHKCEVKLKDGKAQSSGKKGKEKVEREEDKGEDLPNLNEGEEMEQQPRRNRKREEKVKEEEEEVPPVEEEQEREKREREEPQGVEEEGPAKRPRIS